MAESKSRYFAWTLNAYSEKTAKFGVKVHYQHADGRIWITTLTWQREKDTLTLR
jgi:hypothetical protein